MPVTYDFNEGASHVLGNFTPTGQLATCTDNGVTFSLSATTVTGNAFAYLGGNASTLFPVWISRGTGATPGDVFHLAPTGPTPNISGTAADKIILSYGSITGKIEVRFTHSTAGGTVTKTVERDVDPLNGTITATGSFTGITFTLNGRNGGVNSIINIKSLTAKSVSCFTSGTLIDTPDGAVEVQTLQPGDRVLTAEGRVTHVKWLGEQFMDTRIRHPQLVNPVCITAGALGNDLPKRDLHLSQDHAIAVDGVLYNAGALINGETIYRVASMPLDGFTYYHVETEAHELILAEGVPSESFIDYADRDGFDNPPSDNTAPIAEMQMPRVSSARMVPQSLRNRLSPQPPMARSA